MDKMAIKNKFIFLRKLGLLAGVLVLLILLPVISGEVQTLGFAKQNTCISLKQNCANCSYVNISAITYPNKTTINNIWEMTKEGIMFNYTFCNTYDIGQYIIDGYGDVDGIKTIFEYNFEVTQSGSTLSTAQGIIYFIALALGFIFFLMSLYFSFTIPFKNRRNDYGKIISINQIKYIKLFMIMIAYSTLLFVVGISYQITNNFLYLTGISNLFNWIYWLMLSGLYPAIVLIFAFIIIIFFEDLTSKKKIKRWHLG